MADKDGKYNEKYIVYIYMQDFERTNSLPYPIPDCIFGVCALFYHSTQYYLQRNNIKPTPLTILFAMHNAISPSKCLKYHFETDNLLFQCECLNLTNICLHNKRERAINGLLQLDELKYQTTMNVLSIYNNHMQFVLNTHHINQWTVRDVVLSFIYYLTNNLDPLTLNVKTRPKAWEFVEYFRIYCDDLKYDGTYLWKHIHINPPSDIIPNISYTKGYGLTMMKNICFKYSLKSGPFSKVKKTLNPWAETVYKQFCKQHIKPLHRQITTEPISKKTDHQLSEYTVYGYVHKIENQNIFYYPIPFSILQICLKFYHEQYLPLNSNKIIPTPFTLLFAIYNTKNLLNISEWQTLNIDTQLNYLSDFRMNTNKGRTKLSNELCEKINLKHNGDMCDQLKHILFMYNHTSQSLNVLEIDKWSNYNIMISLIKHVIENRKTRTNLLLQQNRNERLWRFINYFRQSIYESNDDVIKLLNSIMKSKSAVYSKGFGLMMMKKICQHYHLKSGQYSLSKKYFNSWLKSVRYNIMVTTPHDLMITIESNNISKVFPYSKFTKSAILSLFAPLCKDEKIDIVAVFANKRKSGLRKGISIVIHVEGLTACIGEANDKIKKLIQHWFEYHHQLYSAFNNIWPRDKSEPCKIKDLWGKIDERHPRHNFFFLTNFQQ